MTEEVCEGRAGLFSLLYHWSTTSGGGRRRVWVNVVSEGAEVVGGAIWVLCDTSATVPALDAGLLAVFEVEGVNSSLGSGEGRTAAKCVEVEEG